MLANQYQTKKRVKVNSYVWVDRNGRGRGAVVMEKPPFWTFSSDELLKELTSESSGLTQEEAKIRIKMYGANLLKPRKSHSNLALFLAQFKSPIILILIIAAALPYSFLGPLFGFVPLPAAFFPVLAIILLLYITSAEMAKKLFYKGGRYK